MQEGWLDAHPEIHASNAQLLKAFKQWCSLFMCSLITQVFLLLLKFFSYCSCIHVIPFICSPISGILLLAILHTSPTLFTVHHQWIALVLLGTYSLRIRWPVFLLLCGTLHYTRKRQVTTYTHRAAQLRVSSAPHTYARVPHLTHSHAWLSSHLCYSPQRCRCLVSGVW